jgi:cell division septation protein DedD
MAADNVKHFEFRLGKWGLVLFVFGMSLLVFFSFLFGVIVGKDIDAYPEKYSWGISNKIMENFGWSRSPENSKTVVAVREAGKEHSPSENSEYDLSFYETLSKKSNNLTKQHSGAVGTDKLSTEPIVPPGEKAAKLPSTGLSQVNKKSKTEKKGEKPVTDKLKETEISHHRKPNLAFQGENEKQSMVNPLREKVRETKTPVVVKNAEQKAEKNIIPEKKINQATDKVTDAEKKTGMNQVRKDAKKESGVKPEAKSYLVQVGSYRDREKAEQVSNKLKSLGYTPADTYGYTGEREMVPIDDWRFRKPW